MTVQGLKNNFLSFKLKVWRDDVKSIEIFSAWLSSHLSFWNKKPLNAKLDTVKIPRYCFHCSFLKSEKPSIENLKRNTWRCELMLLMYIKYFFITLMYSRFSPSLFNFFLLAWYKKRRGYSESRKISIIIKMHPTTFQSFIKWREREKRALKKYFSIISSAFRDEKMGNEIKPRVKELHYVRVIILWRALFLSLFTLNGGIKLLIKMNFHIIHISQSVYTQYVLFSRDCVGKSSWESLQIFQHNFPSSINTFKAFLHGNERRAFQWACEHKICLTRRTFNGVSFYLNEQCEGKENVCEAWFQCKVRYEKKKLKGKEKQEEEK